MKKVLLWLLMMFSLNIFSEDLPDPNQAEEKMRAIQTIAKKISMNFQDVSVRAALQLLAEFTGVNMVVSDTVHGNVTMRLHQVPWERALDIILTSRGLQKRWVGGILMVAPATEMARYQKKSWIIKKQNTRFLPLYSDMIPLHYAKADDIAAMLKDKHGGFLSSRGAINVDKRLNALWIHDTHQKVNHIRTLVKQWDIPVKQILIEARIVNVTRGVSEDLGIRFGSLHVNTMNEPESHNENFTGRVGANHLNIDLMAHPLGMEPASFGVALLKLGDDVLLDLELSALESEGRGKIISSPRLMTTNQRPAVIESGEEIPYQESTLSGATSVAFKKAVLRLKVTPHIMADKKILMDLHINQDTPSSHTFNGVPTILTKEIKTEVLVNDAETIVLGGIRKKDKNAVVHRVPFFGSLPIFGYLFQNKSIEIKNEELLIFITPRIIASADLNGSKNIGKSSLLKKQVSFAKDN